MAETLEILTLLGRSASREVLLGFAPAKTLHSLSFADVLNETAGTGYQRPFSTRHSLDFRRYIRKPGATTPPLTFNLRPRADRAWWIELRDGGLVSLHLSLSEGPLLAQVDCQHRLGHLDDLSTHLPFMVFLGLTEREEMEVFHVINSKAKGLSGSLLDYHVAQLAHDLGKEKPELFVALSLNENPDSPWYKQLDLGGSSTSGLKRKASLRTMQKAVRRFLAATSALDDSHIGDVARVVTDFWVAVAQVLRTQWLDHRRHFLTKGIGVYALMGLLGDLWRESRDPTAQLTEYRLVELLDGFARAVDWANDGPMKGLGGEAGAQTALEILRNSRASSLQHAIAHGQ